VKKPKHKKHASILANSQRDITAAAQLRIVGGEITIDLSAAGDDGKPKQPTFKINAYNGGVMQLSGWFNPVIIDLAGMKAMSQTIPIFLNHESDRIVGQTRKVSIDADGVNLVGTITGGADDPDVAKVVGHSKGGFKWQASIGANPTRREFLEAGKTAQVNGRTVTGPMIIARESLLLETSFVAIGADITTSADIAASHSHEKDRDMNFEAWLKAKGVDISKIDDATKAVLKAAFDAEVLKASTPPPVTAPAPTAPAAAGAPAGPAVGTNLEAALAAGVAENNRRNAIADMTAKTVADRPDMSEALIKLSRTALDEKWTAQAYELEVIRAAREVPNVIVGGPKVPRADVIEAAVCMAGGLGEEGFKPEVLEAADKTFRNGIGLGELVHMFAGANGYRGSARITPELLRAAFADNGMMRASAPSNYTLTNILSNVANKFLAKGFNAVEDTWKQIAAIKPVNNFQQAISYSMTGDFAFQEVAPGGNLKHAVAAETGYTNQAKTYGRMFSIDRRDLINDDLGALTAAPQRLGRGGALKLNSVFWTEFMDNASFFTAATGSYDEDTDTALAIAGLTLADILFRNQTDPDGNPIGISPKILLVPNALVVTAKALMNSLEVRDTTASTKIGTANPFAGAYTVVSSSYLGNSSISGYSTTAWYLLADPNDLPVIEVAFLNGKQMPTVENAEADFNSLGIQMRGYWDFGVAKQEYRAGVKMAGVNVP
jgi:phage major head subunit gpT-like protein